MIKEIEILRYRNRGFEKVNDKVVEEINFKIFVNKKEFAVLTILPEKIESFIYGFLFTNSLIESVRDIKKLKISGNICKVEVYNKRKISFSKNFEKDDVKISSKKIFSILKKFQNMSKIYRDTGGVHSCGISDGNDILVFAEDISRHNAFDKVVGEAILKNINLRDKIVLTSGRITSDTVFKGIRIKVPVIVSISAPSFYAIELGKLNNITLIGFARGKRFNVYTCEWRIL
ncbi:MAG: formate dehydrogenase accessory sulfurtransferase FdhD [Candidatus Omnitrophica bacterium]|nr:formate dehydrogenase accessory sulfurtransferase FdhD [Candidatus Omnitrophota bacterium]MCM8807318.1 formate dehydrogenase accessory sulfurtransferase FdhD [Candidatus Omnitrophota bacterium]